MDSVIKGGGFRPVAPELYRDYFIKKEDERKELFALLADRCGIAKGLYPGSFVHISPSFAIPEMMYVDTDKRTPRFFADPAVLSYIGSRKKYREDTVVRFHHGDFTQPIPAEKNYFDLLVSLYSGFVSQHCKDHLKEGGHLLANNSHGDATLASIDPDFALAGVIKRDGERFRCVEDDLESYLVPKNGKPVDADQVRKTMRGVAFSKTGYAYLFKKSV